MNIRTHKGKDMITEQGEELEETVKISYPQLQPLQGKQNPYPCGEPGGPSARRLTVLPRKQANY